MPYARPTLSALRDQVLQDINAARIQDANGNIVDGTLPKSIMRVLAYAQAGLAYGEYGYLDWIAKQAVPFTATDEFLAAWGALKGVLRKAATAAAGTATFFGAAGTDIPNGTAITRADGIGYVTTADVAIGAGGTATVPISATTTGADGNVSAGAILSLANPISGVQSQGVAAAVVVGGADLETDESFRTRVLQRYAAPPQGGDRFDYVEWALAVSGVTRVWVAPGGAGGGTVIVYVMFDDVETAFGGFPQGANGVAATESRGVAATGDQLAVANAIDPLRPVTALVYVYAPVASPVSFSIVDLGANNTPAMQATITTALQDMFFRLGNVGGTVNPDTGAPWPPIEPSAWYAALEAVPGLTSFRVTTPATSITPLGGHLFTLGTVSFAS